MPFDVSKHLSACPPDLKEDPLESVRSSEMRRLRATSNAFSDLLGEIRRIVDTTFTAKGAVLLDCAQRLLQMREQEERDKKQ